MSRVIAGVDAHKKSVTIEVVDAKGQVLATGRFDTTSTGRRLMTAYVAQWTDRPRHCGMAMRAVTPCPGKRFYFSRRQLPALAPY